MRTQRWANTSISLPLPELLLTTRLHQCVTMVTIETIVVAPHNELLTIATKRAISIFTVHHQKSPSLWQTWALAYTLRTRIISWSTCEKATLLITQLCLLRMSLYDTGKTRSDSSFSFSSFGHFHIVDTHFGLISAFHRVWILLISIRHLQTKWLSQKVEPNGWIKWLNQSVALYHSAYIIWINLDNGGQCPPVAMVL